MEIIIKRDMGYTLSSTIRKSKDIKDKHRPSTIYSAVNNFNRGYLPSTTHYSPNYKK